MTRETFRKPYRSTPLIHSLTVMGRICKIVVTCRIASRRISSRQTPISTKSS